jgi:2-oxoglutarate dehydrogenase E2 component (dihydrolipoamide succinyltransferase)
MAGEIVVPTLGESVSEATVAKWFKKVGDAVTQDEPLLELETDKVTLEVNAPASGKLKDIKVAEGQTVEVGTLLGLIEVGAAGAQSSNKVAAPVAPVAAAPKAAIPHPTAAKSNADVQNPPSVRKMLEETGINPANVPATGKDGRLTKGDVLSASQSAPSQPSPASGRGQEKREERVKMSKLRQVIAKRLKESQNTAAILTTFNEIDMSNVIALRNEYKDAFEKKHGVRMGFMSFFVKAAVNALKEIPAVNAQIDGDELIYKNYYDIGVAVGTDQGLVVPVVRNADQLSFAEIEKEIGRLAGKAREGSLSMAELTGGTFTVTNGGVYGSLMSTPIINPPQSGILGMHKTEERPIAVKGQVVIRPMMYVAMSYDHRIIDGKESVTFLVRVKESIEDPRRILLGL